MEVHAHSHTPRKKWTHYFWEFLMLFLAVFCGFLAEYQLEHKIERDREKQYIQSLMNDLKTDVVNIEVVQKQNLVVRQIGDSLFTLLSLPDYSNSTNSIYYLGRSFSSAWYCCKYFAPFFSCKARAIKFLCCPLKSDTLHFFCPFFLFEF